MTEFIPNPVEKRESLIRDNVMKLLMNLDDRLKKIEQGLGMESDGARKFAKMVMKIRIEEREVEKVNLQIFNKD